MFSTIKENSNSCFLSSSEKNDMYVRRIPTFRSNNWFVLGNRYFLLIFLETRSLNVHLLILSLLFQYRYVTAVRYPIETKYIATYFSTIRAFFFPLLLLIDLNGQGEGREGENNDEIWKKKEEEKKRTNSHTILKVSKRIFREWVVKRRNERWLVILRSNEKALSRSRKRREEKRTESDAGVRCVGSQADLDRPLSDLWTDYFSIYSPRFKTIT